MLAFARLRCGETKLGAVRSSALPRPRVIEALSEELLTNLAAQLCAPRLAAPAP